MLRTILVAIFLGLFFILSLPVYFVFYLIGKKDRWKKDQLSQSVVQWAFRVVLFISGTTITVKGSEHLPKDQSVLFVGNHRSYFDILTAYVNIPTPVGFVAKKEMEKIPFLSSWMRNIRCLFLDRDNIKEGLKVILQGVSQIKSGTSVFIFPEGTRTKTGEMLPFKEGSTKMAEKSGHPIIPVAFIGTDDVFEKNKNFAMKRAHVTIIFGEPIDPKSLEKEQKKFLGAYIQNIIQTMIDAEVSSIVR